MVLQLFRIVGNILLINKTTSRLTHGLTTNSHHIHITLLLWIQLAFRFTIVFFHLIYQALNNLGSVYVDCGKLELAEDCYIKALKIQHTRAHQGLARVHFLKNDKAAAYKEMTNLIEKARNNASAYEKRSEYGDRDLTKADLEMVTRLDPLRVYPYRYRAAGSYFICLLAINSVGQL